MDKQSFELKGTDPLIYTTTYKFDKYDQKILLALNENARYSLADLSKKVGLSRDAVKDRIQKLIQEKLCNCCRNRSIYHWRSRVRTNRIRCCIFSKLLHLSRS